MKFPSLFCSFVFALEVFWGAGPAWAGQMTLGQAFDQAMAGNPGVQAMAQRINQAGEQVSQTRAEYFPQFNLGAGTGQTRISSNDYDTLPMGDRTREYYDAGLTARWVLFSGSGRMHRLEAADLGRSFEEASRDDLIRTLLASVAASFHRAQLALANQAIAESNKGFYEGQLENARIKKKAGVGSLSDVLNINTRMNQARIEMERFQAEYDVARTALAALLGEGVDSRDLPDPVFPEKESIEEMEEPDPKRLTAFAMDNRPDLVGLTLQTRIARAGIEAARARFYPELSLKGALGADRMDSGRFEADDLESSLGVELSYPLFAGGADMAALNEARYAEKEAQLALENLKNQVASQVRQDCFIVTAAQRQLRLYRENGKLVKKNRDMVEKEFRLGKTSLVNLNEVQNNLSLTRQQIALSLISLRQAWYELKASSGTLEAMGEGGE